MDDAIKDKILRLLDAHRILTLATLRPDGWPQATTVGYTSEGLMAVGERIGADLIVLASHRPAMKDYLLGANASRVVRHAPCSVFVVRDTPE